MSTLEYVLDSPTLSLSFLYFEEESMHFSPLCQPCHVFTCPSILNTVLYYFCD